MKDAIPAFFTKAQCRVIRIDFTKKRLPREQRCLSRKYENLKKGESAQKNIQKTKAESTETSS